MKFLSCLILISSMSVAFAKTQYPREKIDADAEITVRQYNQTPDTFEVVLVHETSVGPNVTTPEWLKSALGRDGSIHDFIKRMIREKGSVYLTKKPLLLLSDDEVTTRNSKAKSHTN